MKDIFINRKGELVCQVKVHSGTVKKIWWGDDNGKEYLAEEPDKKAKSIVTLSLDITYDEWSQGITRYCFVENSNWLEPIKEPYERRSGKDIPLYYSISAMVMV